MTAGVILAITFGLLTLALLAFFWGATAFFQGQLYESVAEKLGLRAAIAALLVGGYLCMWVFINTRAESRDRFGTLFEFTPTASVPYSDFTAIRRSATKKETAVVYKKAASRFVEANEPTKGFLLTTADYLVVAIEVKLNDQPVRFLAELDAKGKYLRTSPRVFREAGGERFLEIGASNIPGPVNVPSRRAFWIAIGLNLGHFVIWLIACWPVLQFELGHSFGAAVVLGIFFMILVLPLLFQKNKVSIPVSPSPVAVAPA